MMFRQLAVPALIVTLLATAACSGNGAPAAPPEAVPAAALEPVSSAASAQSIATAAAPQSIAAASDPDDITPADIAAIDALATEAVPDPAGDAAGAPAWGWTLNGFYHGKLKGYANNGFGSTEHTGYLAMHIDAHLPSYTGSGEATEYGTGATLSFTLSGSVDQYLPHGEILTMTAVAASGCPASGYAARYRSLFEGVLRSDGCGPNPVSYYFKVRPNKT